MTTVNAARGIGLPDQIGALAVGLEADISIVDVVGGTWKFTGTLRHVFIGTHALIPVQTIRAGKCSSPDWGLVPWDWSLPEA